MVSRLRRIPFEVVTAKPLVESDRAVELMDAAEPVKAVWMLRHYRGVARSNLWKSTESNSYLDLQPYCENDRDGLAVRRYQGNQGNRGRIDE